MFDPNAWAYPILADECNREDIHAIDIARACVLNLSLLQNYVRGVKPIPLETALDIRDMRWSELPVECLFYRETKEEKEMEPNYLNIRDVAEKLGVSYSSAWQIITTEIPHMRIGKRIIRVKEQELQKYIKRHEVNKYAKYY